MTDTVLYGTIACTKEVPKATCQKLKSAILAEDKIQVGEQINAFIRHLNARTYTSEYLNSLTHALSKCDLTATVLCFNCIETLPEQSEIQISLSASGTTVTRTIDITYNARNEMVYSNIHE
jgi:hypothetical protein